MDIEVSLSSSTAKAEALALLREAGYAADTGRVRIAHPFAVLVTGLVHEAATEVMRLVRSVDVAAGEIVAPGPAALT